MVHIALVPSPLVGAITWRWVAEIVAAAGHDVVIGETIAADGDLVVVGHSGAGPRLPMLVVERDPANTTVVLVDAPMPTPTGAMPLVPPAFLDHVRSLADADGVLPLWSDWFGPDVMADQVPDPERRAAVIAELPRLPLSYFETTVSIPANWSELGGAYVLLSEVYRRDAEAASARGWTVLERLGRHLDIVTRPDVVADAILSQLEAATRDMGT